MERSRQLASLVRVCLMISIATAFGVIVLPLLAAADTGVDVALNAPISDDGFSYTIVSATQKPDVDGMTRLDIGFRADNSRDAAVPIGEGNFQLRTGDNLATPVSNPNKIVEAHAAVNSTVSFVVSSTATNAMLLISFPSGTTKELPMTLQSSAAANDPEDLRAQGRAEVTGDVDMYDAPGGVGNKYPGWLEGGDGQTVELITCHDDNWCNVIRPDGQAVWVWGEFIKR